MDRILITLKKENGPRASSAPALGLNTIIFKYVYWCMKRISGERSQDHWSSGLTKRLICHNLIHHEKTCSGFLPVSVQVFYELRNQKNPNNLHMQKQSRRSAVHLSCFSIKDSTIHLLSKLKISSF